MEDDDQTCTLDLNLELGLGGYMGKKEKQKVIKSVASSDLTFELSSKDEDETLDERGFSLKRLHEEHHHPNENSFDDNMNESRKKLRLTKEQSAILEDTFKLHNTINNAQKRALAEQLNLKQRQVEVWFQNRRARTKLKETEVNCTLLQRSKDKLTEENLRLKKEIEELRALKVGSSQPYTQYSNASILTVCSSCKKLLMPNEGNNNNEDISDVVSDKS